MNRRTSVIRSLAIVANVALLVLFLLHPRVGFSGWPRFLRIFSTCEFCERPSTSSIVYRDQIGGNTATVHVCDVHARDAPQRHTPGSSKLFGLVMTVLGYAVGLLAFVGYPFAVVMSIRSGGSAVKAQGLAAIFGAILALLVQLYASELLVVELTESANLAKPLFWCTLYAAWAAVTLNLPTDASFQRPPAS